MLGLITIGIAFLAAKKLDDSGNYKKPIGKHKNRYK